MSTVAHFIFDTPLGRCGIAWNDAGVTAFALPPPDRLAAGSPAAEPPPWVAPIVARVQRHLAGEAQDFSDVRYDWSRVSTFQRGIYEAALLVKSGQTLSYGQLAAAIGQTPAVARAVGTALGQNPWPLLVPCHRFIGARGRMTGFSAPGGIKTKLRLLALEGSQWFAE